MKDNYRVDFVAEGFSCTAYFDCVIDFEIFARMMASEGRLVKAIGISLDVTERFATLIRGN